MLNHASSNSCETITLATRTELFRILSFLDSRLPSASPIHTFIHSAIISQSPKYRIYYVRDAEAEGYTAIFGLKNEFLIDSQQHSMNCWFTIHWDESDPQQLCRISDTIREIDWDQDALLSLGFGDPGQDAIFYRYLGCHAELILDERSPITQYYLPREEAITIHLEMPSDVYVKNLEVRHAKVVHQNSLFRSNVALEDVRHEIEHLPSAGVFLKHNDELVSWIMCHPPLGMMRLGTFEPYRRRGYAKLAVRYLSKAVAQSGCVPFVSIIKGNNPAIALFESLGFKFLWRREIYLIPAPADICSQAT